MNAVPIKTEPTTIRVGTLNLRNTADRWPERSKLLLDQLSDLGPDIIGFQELRRLSRQRQIIERGANRGLPSGQPPYRLYSAWKSGFRRVWEGLAVLTELPVVETERRDLRGGHRVAQRVRVRLSNSSQLDFFNVHLHHTDDDPRMRRRQVQRLLDWMNERPSLPQVLVGDFNALPDDPAMRLITHDQRLRSAFVSVHGAEPDQTVPTPLNRNSEEPGRVIDYIFVNDLVDVHDAWITFDRFDPADQSLAASDHFGLAATISVRLRG